MSHTRITNVPVRSITGLRRMFKVWFQQDSLSLAVLFSRVSTLTYNVRISLVTIGVLKLEKASLPNKKEFFWKALPKSILCIPDGFLACLNNA